MQSQDWQDKRLWTHHPSQDWCPHFSLNVLWDCSCKSKSKRAHQPTLVFCVESTKMVFAVVVPHTCFILLGMVSLSLTLPVNSSALFVLQLLRAWCAFNVSWWLHLFLCLFLFLLIPTLVLLEIRGMNLPDLPGVSRLEGHLDHGCACCTCVARINAPAMIFVVVGWFSLCYSQHPHDALVVFVSEAALQLQGAACCHCLVPCCAWDVSVPSALAPLNKNGVNCDHQNQGQWSHFLLLLVVTCLVPTLAHCVHT